MLGFDKWLNRVALGSQILLVIIALITIKYTVIPLYQKELSSEELAKAQIQLGNVQAKINELTSNVASKELSLISTSKKLNEAEGAERSSRESLAVLNKELSVQLKILADLKGDAEQLTRSHRPHFQAGFFQPAGLILRFSSRFLPSFC
ncbi:hypothetical protein C4C37_09325 [Pseudomonas amygdali pv. lachrymans]|uniref:Uncharacterized protein n=3 Tax=Pseudomonas amygdali TaxID=47877 RepID=A0AAD0M016_PSEAV|nr:hypothetical protein [Pseudomonas amygdali]ARA79887.1 hypothetical protein B5U27_07310 [Pseudomonas amygdali pv. lachrymans]AXH57108.1 hypothetical protein PLA107_018750 [Pseudomonas amygdali pv. lachrymans str. M301315]PWD03124.1 hypothetical protein CX658_12340 [Pseudomonas amygdali pv. lachrymans]QWA51832.1 hypothetical protein C4C37_09325 [Pseudomonas amygdali pv. lachrymans]